MVATLKRRFHEALESGKASDAKAYLDIIDRLAKMAWLDDTTPRERLRAKYVRRRRIMAEVDRRLAQYVRTKPHEKKKDSQDL